MEALGNILGYFVVFWLIAFPFLYGQLLSRLFGLKKKIDHWILFLLHITVYTFSFVFFWLFSFLFVESDYLANIVVILPLILLVLVVVSEGFVWQFSLRDRKMNGFLISLICNAAFLAPLIPIAIYVAITTSGVLQDI